MLYRYIYKIICLKGKLNNECLFYIGQHTTDNMNDGYAGSGILITQYYQKHGKIEGKTYKKIILKDNIKSQKALDNYERYFIDKNIGKDTCLNLVEGGLDAVPRRKKEARDYFNNEGVLVPCYTLSHDITDIHTTNIMFDEETDLLINELKNDKHNWNIREKLIMKLGKYGTTPKLLGI